MALRRLALFDLYTCSRSFMHSKQQNNFDVDDGDDNVDDDNNDFDGDNGDVEDDRVKQRKYRSIFIELKKIISLNDVFTTLLIINFC